MAWIAAVSEPRRLDASEDGVELGVADMKGVVVAFELAVLVAEQHRHLVVDAHRREIMDGFGLQSEEFRKETCRRHLVMRRDNGVVEDDGHRTPPRWRRQSR